MLCFPPRRKRASKWKSPWIFIICYAGKWIRCTSIVEKNIKVNILGDNKQRCGCQRMLEDWSLIPCCSCRGTSEPCSACRQYRTCTCVIVLAKWHTQKQFLQFVEEEEEVKEKKLGVGWDFMYLLLQILEWAERRSSWLSDHDWIDMLLAATKD